MRIPVLAALACSALLSVPAFAQTAAPMAPMGMEKSSKPLASPAATASVSLGGKDVTIKYNSPSIKGRKIGGEVAPYGKVWRTGANPATTLITAAALKIGTLTVPAGSYTIYTLPSASTWQLIINKQNGQWGTDYDEKQDLGRTPLKGKTLPASQEAMTISFENTKGKATELHIKWAMTDESVAVTAQ